MPARLIAMSSPAALDALAGAWLDVAGVFAVVAAVPVGCAGTAIDGVGAAVGWNVAETLGEDLGTVSAALTGALSGLQPTMPVAVMAASGTASARRRARRVQLVSADWMFFANRLITDAFMAQPPKERTYSDSG